MDLAARCYRLAALGRVCSAAWAKAEPDQLRVGFDGRQESQITRGADLGAVAGAGGAGAKTGGRRLSRSTAPTTLEEAGDYVRWWVGRMVDAGYHPIAAEGFAAHGRRAVADAQVRLGVQRRRPWAAEKRGWRRWMPAISRPGSRV